MLINFSWISFNTAVCERNVVVWFKKFNSISFPRFPTISFRSKIESDNTWSKEDSNFVRASQVMSLIVIKYSIEEGVRRTTRKSRSKNSNIIRICFCSFFFDAFLFCACLTPRRILITFHAIYNVYEKHGEKTYLRRFNVMLWPDSLFIVSRCICHVIQRETRVQRNAESRRESTTMTMSKSHLKFASKSLVYPRKARSTNKYVERTNITTMNCDCRISMMSYSSCIQNREHVARCKLRDFWMSWEARFIISCIISSFSLLFGFSNSLDDSSRYTIRRNVKAELASITNRKQFSCCPTISHSDLYLFWSYIYFCNDYSFYSLFIRRRRHIMRWSGNWSFLNFHHCKGRFCIR